MIVSEQRTKLYVSEIGVGHTTYNASSWHAQCKYVVLAISTHISPPHEQFQDPLHFAHQIVCLAAEWADNNTADDR